MLIVLTYVLILWGIIAIAWLGALWLKQRGAAEPGQFTNIVVFVGFLFGVIRVCTAGQCSWVVGTPHRQVIRQSDVRPGISSSTG